jgi:DNA-binding CsgD family transcriptional regulator
LSVDAVRQEDDWGYPALSDGFIGDSVANNLGGSQMFTKEILGLCDYLAQSRRSLDELCEFLTVVTFSFLSPRALYIGEIASDGYIDLRSAFGFDEFSVARWSRIPMTVKIPLTESIAKNECILVPNPKVFLKSYPDLKELGEIDTNWKTSLAVPIQRHGAFYLVLHGEPEMSSEFEHLLRSVGNLILIHLRELQPLHEKPAVKISTATKLTTRQTLIHNLLVHGYTNPEIAREIGYSESLVRQETITIYAFLGVSGRKELIRNDAAKVSEPA